MEFKEYAKLMARIFSLEYPYNMIAGVVVELKKGNTCNADYYLDELADNNTVIGSKYTTEFAISAVQSGDIGVVNWLHMYLDMNKSNFEPPHWSECIPYSRTIRMTDVLLRKCSK